MDERLQFIAEYLDGFFTMSELCERHGISRQAGYKWVARYATEGAAGLRDRSRRPHHSPRATAPEIVGALLAARRRHPSWGPKKLLSHGWTAPTRPAVSTASALLKQHGLVTGRQRRARPAHPGRPTLSPGAPNAVWTIDFKGQFRTGDGTWCYPLTVIDGFSRYLLACHGLSSVRTWPTRAVLERVFREFGLPARIRSDNGAPFASSWGLRRLSPLAVWWIRLGIVPELIEPGRPDQNGGHERFHRTLKRETARPPAATTRAQQVRFRRFRREYNHVRPHEALGQQPPAALYVAGASGRPYPATLPPLDYPPAAVVRRVTPSGSLKWYGRWLWVSHTLSGQDVAFIEIDDGWWTVSFGSVVLGHFDERRWRIQPIARISEGALVGSADSRPAGKNINRVSTMSPD